MHLFSLEIIVDSQKIFHKSSTRGHQVIDTVGSPSSAYLQTSQRSKSEVLFMTVSDIIHDVAQERLAQFKEQFKETEPDQSDV